MSTTPRTVQAAMKSPSTMCARMSASSANSTINIILRDGRMGRLFKLGCQLGENQVSIQFSDHTFVSDGDVDGDGTVLIPLESLGYDSAGLRKFAVVDRSGRSAVFEGGSCTYYSDSVAGTKEFVGWSYWESESTEDPDGPCVHLMVLSPGFNEADYR